MKKLFCTLILLFSCDVLASIDCNSPSAIPTTKEECLKILELIDYAMFHEEQEVCYLKECPDGYFFDSRHKNCLPCDYVGQECLDVSPEECAKCPNRKMNKYKFTTQCEIPFSCPPDKPAMRIWAGFEDSCGKDCYSCEEAGNGFWADDCSVCPGYEVEVSPEFNFGKVFCINKNPELFEDEENVEYYDPEIAPLP